MEERRILEEANIIINTKISILELSRLLHISREKIYKDIEKLKHIDINIYKEVKKALKSKKNVIQK